jgi:ketosteroid isomerase-like protein
MGSGAFDPSRDNARAMSQENVEIVRRGLATLLKAMERRDFDAVFDSDVLADDVEWIPTRSFPGPNSYRGRDGVSEFMRTWAEDFGDLSFDIEQLIDAPDDRVVALIHQRASGQASGVPVEMDLAAVYDLKGGRVIRIRNYLEPAEALEAAGLRE